MTVTARSAVVKIIVTFPDGAYSSSGVVGDANTIFTAEHTLVHNGVIASSISIVLNNGERVETVGASAIHPNVPAADWQFVGNVIPVGQSARDYAAISLNTPIGLSTGWFDLNSGFVSGRVRLAGYPGGQGYEELTGGYNDILASGASIVVGITPAPTRPGFSGGPVWTDIRGTPELVGVISGGSAVSTIVADISPQTAARLIEWATSDDYLVADAVNRAQVTKLFEVGVGRAPTAGEMSYVLGFLTAGATMDNIYAVAVKIPEVEIRLLYDTVLNRQADSLGVQYWLGQMNNGMSFSGVVSGFLESHAAEISALYGPLDNQAFVEQLYWNVVGQPSDGGTGRDYWVSRAETLGRTAVIEEATVLPVHLATVGSINPLDGTGVFPPRAEIAGINTDAVQRLYVAYFNRPADPIGLEYWESRLPDTVANQAELTTLAGSGFSGSAEYAGLYAGQDNEQTVNSLYNNLFGRNAEPAGLVHWAGRLTAGTETFASIALQLTYSAQSTDATAIANKLAASTAFTTALDTIPEIVGYSGTAAAASARSWLARVTDTATPLSTATADMGADNNIVGIVGIVGSVNPSLDTGIMA